jgi:hypothetical protein
VTKKTGRDKNRASYKEEEPEEEDFPATNDKNGDAGEDEEGDEDDEEEDEDVYEPQSLPRHETPADAVAAML